MEHGRGPGDPWIYEDAEGRRIEDGGVARPGGQDGLEGEEKRSIAVEMLDGQSHGRLMSTTRTDGWGELAERLDSKQYIHGFPMHLVWKVVYRHLRYLGMGLGEAVSPRNARGTIRKTNVAVASL